MILHLVGYVNKRYVMYQLLKRVFLIKNNIWTYLDENEDKCFTYFLILYPDCFVSISKSLVVVNFMFNLVQDTPAFWQICLIFDMSDFDAV
jgi:hypothetical protein